MQRYDPERLERSTRDVVSRSSYMEIMAGRGTPHGRRPASTSRTSAPSEVEQRSRAWSSAAGIRLRPAHEPVEVSPTAHFHMGGVAIDADCHTTLEGCFVAGEDAGGVHGANRLGGNGVAESTVFGCRAGDTAAVVARSRGTRVASRTSSGPWPWPPRRSTGPTASCPSTSPPASRT